MLLFYHFYSYRKIIIVANGNYEKPSAKIGLKKRSRFLNKRGEVVKSDLLKIGDITSDKIEIQQGKMDYKPEVYFKFE